MTDESTVSPDDERDPLPSHYRAPAVAGLLKRGDEAAENDEWEAAYNCYVAALFCQGGRDPLLKARAQRTRRVRQLRRLTAAAPQRLEAALGETAALQALAQELQHAGDEASSLCRIWPESAELPELARRLAQTQAQAAQLLKTG